MTGENTGFFFHESYEDSLISRRARKKFGRAVRYQKQKERERGEKRTRGREDKRTKEQKKFHSDILKRDINHQDILQPRASSFRLPGQAKEVRSPFLSLYDLLHALLHSTFLFRFLSCTLPLASLLTSHYS